MLGRSGKLGEGEDVKHRANVEAEERANDGTMGSGGQ